MAPSPTVLTLEHTQVHIYTSDGSNIVFYVKALINKAFDPAFTLNILYIYPNNGHVWFRWYFDNTQFGDEYDIVKDLVLFDNFFNVIK